MNFAKYLSLMMALMTLILFNVGCSGINAGGTVSPAMFFIPGFTVNENKSTNLLNINEPIVDARDSIAFARKAEN